MLCPDRRSLIIARGMRHAERRNEWRMCGKFCGLFIARRFQLLRVCCKEKKKGRMGTKREVKKRTDRLKTEQKDNSSMRKQSKIESCTHKVPQPQPESLGGVFFFFFWPHSLSHSHALYLCLCVAFSTLRGQYDN